MKANVQTAKMSVSRIREAAADGLQLTHSTDCTYSDFNPCTCDLKQRKEAWREKFSEITDHNLDTIRDFARRNQLEKLIDDWKRLYGAAGLLEA